MCIRDRLEECYRINYHPSNMVLVGVCSEDPENIMKIIRENQSGKKFPKMAGIKRLEFDESEKPAREKMCIRDSCYRGCF